MPPALSIVMPCLNAASTIERSLDSIAQQALDSTEVVVVDGGSTDGTDELLSRRPEVRWISEPDGGLSDAYNKGARMATGDVLGWLNADDVYLPGSLADVRQAFDDDQDLVWLTGQCLIVDGAGDEIRRPVTRYKNALLSRHSHRLHLTHNYVSAPSTFFRRQEFLQTGGLDVHLRYSMDYDLFLRLGRLHHPAVLERPLASFTMAAGTLSMTGFDKQFVEHREVARRYRDDAPTSYVANVALSRAIVLAYKGMRRLSH